jgi:soluble lytic murein transglycosylase-like protein
MLASKLVPQPTFQNVFVRFCFILLLAMPVFADSIPAASALAARPAGTALRVKTVVLADAKTGRLVRTTVAPAAPATPRTPPAELNAIVDRIAGQQGVEAQLVHSVILAESNYNAAAVSPKGAQGIMQLIPSTARRFGVSNSFDAADNIQGGVRYLRFLLDYYHGDYTKAIAAYNAGEGAVDKYHGVPPYAETLGYVRTVAKNLTAGRRNASVNTPVPAQPGVADTHHHIQAQLGADGLIYYKTP